MGTRKERVKRSRALNLESLEDRSLLSAGNPALAMRMGQINQQLAVQGLNIAVEAIDFFTIGGGRPSTRIHQEESRWVANDPRRPADFADGNNITYLVDQRYGDTASGLTNAQTEAAIDRAMNTWDDTQALAKVDLVKQPDTDADPDIFDSISGFGGSGTPFLADIVDAGWRPRAFFDAVEGPGGGSSTLAFTVTFIFTDSTGRPTDINGDNYLDTAFTETYYNNTFGDRSLPGNDRAGNPWGINVPLPGIDVETVALHENGHALGLGHFGPPPVAVMNPVYHGIMQDPAPTDLAGMHTIWSSWPNDKPISSERTPRRTAPTS